MARPKKSLMEISPTMTDLTDPPTIDQVPLTGFSESAPSSDKKPRGRKAGASIDKEIAEIEAGLDGLLKSASEAVALSYFIGNPLAGDDSSDIWENQLDDDKKHKLTQAFCRAARQNSNLRKALVSLVHVSAYGDIAIALIGILSPIIMRHMFGPLMPNLRDVEYGDNGN